MLLREEFKNVPFQYDFSFFEKRRFGFDWETAYAWVRVNLADFATIGNLGYTYRSAGRLKDAIPQYERVVADMERLLPAGHRDALAARAILGAAYQQGRRLREAITTYERVVADSERALGPGDIDTLTTRRNLATAYNEAGRTADGVKVLRRALADCERYLGAGHPMTSTVRDNLHAATE